MITNPFNLEVVASRKTGVAKHTPQCRIEHTVYIVRCICTTCLYTYIYIYRLLTLYNQMLLCESSERLYSDLTFTNPREVVVPFGVDI